MGDVLITERLPISNATSRADNSSPLMSWKSPPYYRVLAFFRGVRKSWQASRPPSSDGRAPSSSREDGGRGGSTPGRIPAPRRGDAGSGRNRRPGVPGRSGLPAAGERSPGPSDSRRTAPRTPAKGSVSPLSSAAGILCYRKP